MTQKQIIKIFPIRDILVNRQTVQSEINNSELLKLHSLSHKTFRKEQNNLNNVAVVKERVPV